MVNGHYHTVSSVGGYFFDHEFPSECSRWQTFDNKKLLTKKIPMIPKIKDGMSDTQLNLQSLALDKKELLLWFPAQFMLRMCEN